MASKVQNTHRQLGVPTAVLKDEVDDVAVPGEGLAVVHAVHGHVGQLGELPAVARPNGEVTTWSRFLRRLRSDLTRSLLKSAT